MMVVLLGCDGSVVPDQDHARLGRPDDSRSSARHARSRSVASTVIVRRIGRHTCRIKGTDWTHDDRRHPTVVISRPGHGEVSRASGVPTLNQLLGAIAAALPAG
jgi:hypothetical protein